MFIKRILFIGLLGAFVLPTSFQVQSADDDKVNPTLKIDKLANGLDSYLMDQQAELLSAGSDLLSEHQDETKKFIDTYNKYTAELTKKTSKPISLSGDNDCLANLRLIDLDLIPVDPMDLLKPLKIMIKDFINQSPCDMLTDKINDQIDKIDFSLDSPFGSVGIKANPEDKKADDEMKRQKKLARKARARTLLFDMGKDFKLKVRERRDVVFNDDGSIVEVTDYELKRTESTPVTEDLVNKEGLLNVFEVFGKFMSSDGSIKSLETPNNKIDTDFKDSQRARALERKAADIKARAEALIKTGQGK
ncbi:MAG: hypothetical protein ACI87J_001528 [Colwellia sp.]|jgi:hypothetical protein